MGDPTAAEFEARAAVVAERPDPSDPDVWPDIARLPGRMLLPLEFLRAEIDCARARGLPVDRLERLRAVIVDAREALTVLTGVSALEGWRLLHPAHFDAVDAVEFGCRNPECERDGERMPVELSVLHGRRRAPHRYPENVVGTS